MPHAMVLAAKPEKALPRRARCGVLRTLWRNDVELPLSWVSRKPAWATGSIGIEQDQLKKVNRQDAPSFNEGDEGPVPPQT